MSVRCSGGRYTIDYYDDGRQGKRRRMLLPAGTTAEQADELHAELIKRRRRDADALPENRTIAAIVPSYLEYCRALQSPRTVKDKRASFDGALLPFFGRLRVQDLTNKTLLLYQEQRRAAFAAMQEADRKKHNIGTGACSINKELAYFGGFLKWARKYHGSYAAERLERERLPYKRPTPAVLTREEAERLIAAAEPGYRPLFLALFHLGLRISSAVGLRWDRVDLQPRAADSSVIIMGKGSKENALPLSDELHASLLELQRARLAIPEAERSPWVFPSRHIPGQHVQDVRKALSRARTAAGIIKRVHPHLLRHSLATHLLDEGVDLRIIQGILGHAQVTTSEWYAQVSLELKKSAMRRAGIGSRTNRRRA